MTVPLDINIRHVIPRWRDSNSAAAQGELDPLTATVPEAPVTEDFLQQKLADWSENRTLVYAADLVASGLVLGRVEEVKDAATFILEHSRASAVLADMASRALSKQGTPP